jgi:hypothetical protein
MSQIKLALITALDALQAEATEPPIPITARAIELVNDVIDAMEEPQIDGWPLWSCLPPPAHTAERDALRAELAALKPKVVQVWCDTCEGSGIVHEESQHGVIGSGGSVDCPDCDGNGFNVHNYAAPMPQPAPAQPQAESAPTAQPVQESRSQRMADAGYTPRDSRLTCDECGAKFTAQMAPLHECAQKHPVPVQAAPVSAEVAQDAARYRYLRDRVPADVMGQVKSAAGCWIDGEDDEGVLILFTGEDADAAIDAALAAKGAA